MQKQTDSETEITWNEDEYNYLAIGNSITKHGNADYWWNETSGMAASSADKDYVHLVGAYLDGINDECHFEAYNFSLWETMSYDRAETFELLEPYLSGALNLITIQLGENVSDISTYNNDFKELILYIQERCPYTEIIIIGDFWYSETRGDIKKNIVEEMNITYVDLSEIMDDEDYMCGIGTAVYGADGEPHIVEHDGVAKHPGDKGMEYIANQIIEKMD